MVARMKRKDVGRSAPTPPPADEEEGEERQIEGLTKGSEGKVNPNYNSEDEDKEDEEDGEEEEEDDEKAYEGGEEEEGEDEDEDEEEEEEEDDDEDGEEVSEDEIDREVGDAVLDYVKARKDHLEDMARERDSSDSEGERGEGKVQEGAERGPEGGVRKLDESDTSEDERPSRNTVGDVPLVWYKEEEHIGFDKDGKKIIKKNRKDALDKFLARSDNANDWKTVYDEYNDEEVQLTKEELRMIRRIRQGRLPHAEVNPYEPYVDWFDWEDKGHPLSNAPEPKRRFIPSKWEAKMVVKLVRALRKGWIKLDKPPEKPKVYLLWGDDLKTAQKTVSGLAYIPPPKTKLPGHEESYNPPIEYIPTEEEVKGYELMYEEDRPKFIPKQYESLRSVPAYADFIKERFERCLDLYLCPRTRKKRINIDPESLIPKLPQPRALQPFPTTLSLEYKGHTSAVSSIATDSSGQWLASGSKDGTVRLWEIQTGRCCKVWQMGNRIRQIAWNPVSHLSILAVAVEKQVVLIPMETDSEEQTAVAELLSGKKGATASDSPLVVWEAHSETSGVSLTHKHEVHSVSWHAKGDYFTSVAPDGNTQAVLVHQLSKRATQNPFRRSHGRVERVLFHPNRPFLFVATRTHVRCYNLAKQQLAKKLTAGVQHISSMAIHPGGDNLIVGSEDMRVAWFDMDLSTKPYRTLRNHASGVTNVTFHPSYPLFASSSDDGTAHVFHGMVYSDLLQNPLIVPVKILRGHKVIDQRGVLDCIFHPRQPWLFTAGTDATIKLFCH